MTLAAPSQPEAVANPEIEGILLEAEEFYIGQQARLPG